MQIDFIHKSCYSETLGAKSLSSSKIHEKTGRFSYNSFAPKSSAEFIETQLFCDLKLCLVQDCDSKIIEKEEDCPAEDLESLKFSPTGLWILKFIPWIFFLVCSTILQYFPRNKDFFSILYFLIRNWHKCEKSGSFDSGQTSQIELASSNKIPVCKRGRRKFQLFCFFVNAAKDDAFQKIFVAEFHQCLR